MYGGPAMNKRLKKKLFRKVYGASRHNRNILSAAKKCGCFFCGRIYEPSKIREWTDKGRTAICSYCFVDSVITGFRGMPLSKKLLGNMYETFFGGDEDE